MTKIAFLDSGVGGLTVLDKFCNQSTYKHHDQISEVIYFADLINLPYGGKSPEELTSILTENLQWISSKADVIILACNSSSSLVTSTEIQNLNTNNVFSLTQATAEYLAKNEPNLSNIAIFSTEATHKLNGYQSVLSQAFPKTKIASIPCPKLVPIIEEQASLGKTNFSNTALKELQEYKSKLDFEPEVLIYGCSHYPILRESFSTIFPNTKLIDPADAIHDKLNGYNFIPDKTLVSSYVTSDKNQFAKKLKSLEGILDCAKYLSNSIELTAIAPKV